MTLHTAFEGISQGVKETVLEGQHLVFCLIIGLILFTLRRKPRDSWYYILALLPGYALERVYPWPAEGVSMLVALTLVLALLLEWLYGKLASYALPFLIFSGVAHGLSLSQVVAGSTAPAFTAFTLTATLVQALLILGFGTFCARLSIRSPDAYEGLDNILSAAGTGVAMAYFFLAF